MLDSIAPGKLVLAGEWAVLEAGNLAVIASVNRYLKVKLIPRTDTKIIINLPDYQLHLTAQIIDHQLVLDQDLNEDAQGKLKFVKASIETMASYLNFTTGFELITDSSETNYEIGTKKTKFGFGSSAGITVATISVILKYFNSIQNEVYSHLETIFKLAIISHFQAQNKLGSGLDIASATYGGIIAYSSFDPKWLSLKIKNTNIAELIKIDWPSCRIERLDYLPELIMLVGFTGQAASSPNLINQINLYKEKNPQIIAELYQRIANNSKDLIVNWKARDMTRILASIKKNHLLLQELSDKSNVPLITKELYTLIEIAEDFGFSAKISGAGGGDCGIAFGTEINQIRKIEQSWKDAGIIPLQLNLGQS